MDAAVSRIESFRDFYARLIVAAAGVSLNANAEGLISAFRSVPRERFVGPGPWSVFTPAGYVQTLINDAAILYQDIVVSLVESGPINNGQPSLHAACLAALNLKEGETGLHIGRGLAITPRSSRFLWANRDTFTRTRLSRPSHNARYRIWSVPPKSACTAVRDRSLRCLSAILFT